MKIICIGRNYADHIRELGNKESGNPVIFFKYDEHLAKGKSLSLPTFSSGINYECELVLKFNKDVPLQSFKDWKDVVTEVTLGIDLTARDWQNELKAQGLPWDIAKNFKDSAVLGDFIPVNEALEADGYFNFQFYKNEKLVQEGDTRKMLYDFNRMILFVGQFVDIKAGDVMFTGTPEGVGPMNSGDSYKGILKNKEVLDILLQ